MDLQDCGMDTFFLFPLINISWPRPIMFARVEPNMSAPGHVYITF